MGKDTSWKVYFSDPSRFADVINGFGCGGEQIFSAEDLQEDNSQVLDPEQSKEQFRDMVRKVALGVHYILIGIENQDTIDYEIAFRVMDYDMKEYKKQMIAIRKKVRENPEGLESGEYLYGFRKDSKLMPVTTFILYSGSKPWSGPTCLHDMLDMEGIPEVLHSMIPDYKVNVISLREPIDTEVFKTDFKYVLQFLQCAKDKEKLRELVQNTPYYKEMEKDAFDVVANYANIKGNLETKKYYMDEEKVDMCEGLRDWLEEERAEGRAEGRDGKLMELVSKKVKKGYAISEIAEMFEEDEEVIENMVMRIKKEHSA